MRAIPEGAASPGPIRALVYRGKMHYIVQILEFDLAAQAPSLEEIPGALFKALEAEERIAAHFGQEAFWRLPAAPKEFEAKWASSRPLFSTMPRIPSPAAFLRSGNVEMRQAA